MHACINNYCNPLSLNTLIMVAYRKSLFTSTGSTASILCLNFTSVPNHYSSRIQDSYHYYNIGLIIFIIPV